MGAAVRGARLVACSCADLFALLLASILWFPRLIVDRFLRSGPQLAPTERLKAENDVRTTLLQGLGGLVLLAGAVVTWLQLRARWDELHLSREGQVTERFTRAIDQLGSEKLEVRLGGIYALERIAVTLWARWPTGSGARGAGEEDHKRWLAPPTCVLGPPMPTAGRLTGPGGRALWFGRRPRGARRVTGGGTRGRETCLTPPRFLR